MFSYILKILHIKIIKKKKLKINYENKILLIKEITF